jgi:hypothetical protein
MPDTRFTPRQRQRLRVSFEGSDQDLIAEVSPQGFSVSLPRVLRPGTQLEGSLHLQDRRFPFTGEVTWAHPGDPRLCFVGRMGVRFLRAPQGLFGEPRDAK